MRLAKKNFTELRFCTAFWRCAMALLVSVSAGGFAAGETGESNLSEAEQFFLAKVRPLLSSRCFSCHASEKAEGGLRLDSREAMLDGGDSGPALVPEDPESSLVLLAVQGAHEGLEMPPKDKLAARDVDVLERWIKDGAPWPSVSSAAGDPAGGPVETIGDAWSDERNPIVRLFGGERLDLWSLQPVKRPEAPATERSDWAKNELDQ